MGTSVITVIERAKVDHLNELHRRCEEAKGQALQYALEAGNALLAIKAMLAHGEFGSWIGEHFEGSDRSARVYMQLASAPEISNRQSAADLSIDGALKEIAKPRRMSAGQMGDVLRGAGVTSSTVGTNDQAELETPSWSEQQQRRDRRAGELLTDALRVGDDAHRDGLSASSIARSYRQAATTARRAAVLLDELAMSFER